MPEHDETDAPEEDDDDVATEFWADLTVEERRRRKSKADRWGVEDKVVDGESK